MSGIKYILATAVHVAEWFYVGGLDVDSAVNSLRLTLVWARHH